MEKVHGSEKAMKRKIKSVITKRMKKRGEASVGVGVDLYYPFSDGDDDIGSDVRKLWRFNPRVMSCIFNNLDFEDTHHSHSHTDNQFVYITHLYTSMPSKPSILKAKSVMGEDELNKKMMGEEVEIVGVPASSSSSSSALKVVDDDDVKKKKKKKSMAMAVDFHAKVVEADEDAEVLIAKFYDMRS